MNSPFPGMDPYVEATGIWSNFHHALITACHDLLNERLPENYLAAIEESELPEQSVVHEAYMANSVATLESRTLPQEIELLDAPKQLYIQVLHLPERALVTDIELLSPANKRRGSDDRAAYLSRRRDLILHQVNLVELDLLIKGERADAGSIASGRLFRLCDAMADGPAMRCVCVVSSADVADHCCPTARGGWRRRPRSGRCLFPNLYARTI